jgi:hypothetical protein
LFSRAITSLQKKIPYIFEFLGGNGCPENIPQPQQAEKSNQFSGHTAFTNLNEPNVNAIIVHDGVLLEVGMRTMMG